MGRVTHCGDAAANWRGALASTRLDEEVIDKVVEEVEAMVEANLHRLYYSNEL